MMAAERNAQLFDLETKAKIKFHSMSEDIQFWKWISLKTLALVTPTAVYRWSFGDTSEPVKIFERHTNMSECQIINLRASSDEKWMVLVGIFTQVGNLVKVETTSEHGKTKKHAVDILTMILL